MRLKGLVCVHKQMTNVNYQNPQCIVKTNIPKAQIYANTYTYTHTHTYTNIAWCHSHLDNQEDDLTQLLSIFGPRC